jgi:hypothetical protein
MRFKEEEEERRRRRRRKEKEKKKERKKTHCQSGILYPAMLSFQNKGKMKSS